MNLISVEIGKNISCIGENAFTDSGLGSIYLNNENRLSIAGNTFNIDRIQEVHIPSLSTLFCIDVQYSSSLNYSLPGYRESKIYLNGEHYSDTRIAVPGNVKKIGTYIFYNCKWLEELVIEDGIEEIETYAFYGCNSLSSIYFPKSIKKMGNNLFNGKPPAIIHIEDLMSWCNIDFKT